MQSGASRALQRADCGRRAGGQARHRYSENGDAGGVGGRKSQGGLFVTFGQDPRSEGRAPSR